MDFMQNPKKFKFIFLMFLAMSIWGGSWVSAKSISMKAGFHTLVFLRFFLTTLCYIPFLFIFKESLRVDRKTLFRLLLAAALMILYTQIFFLGLQKGFAGTGGVIVTTLNPIFTFVLSLIFFKIPIRKKQIFALFLGLSGGMLTIQIWKNNLSALLLSGSLLFVVGAVVWAGLTLNSQKAQEKISVWVYSIYIYFIASVFEVFFMDWGDFFKTFDAGLGFWLNLGYLTVLSTTFSTTLYFYSSKVMGSNFTSSFTFIVPISSVFFSWLLIDEAVQPATLLGGSLSMIAVYLLHTKKN